MRRVRNQRSGVACVQPANSSKSAARNAGFTLIELLLVLGLLVTVTSLVMPAMGRYQRAMPLNQAVSMIQSELTRTRLLAIDEAITWTVELKADGDTFQRHRKFDGGARSGETFQLPDGVRFGPTSKNNSAETLQPLHFYADGTVTNATLVLLDSEGIQRELILDRLTGTIRPTTNL
jgi:prepilin-type N-terminal cleavage/methylation domain-containing protein